MATFPLYIKTLSPVHIGNGLEYTPFDYVKTKGRYYFFSPEKVLSLLRQTGNEEAFVEWIESSSKRLQELENQGRDLRDQERKQFNRRKLYPFKRGFVLKKFIEDNGLWDKFFKASSFNEPSYGRIFDDASIKQLIKQNEKIYIPGSEIKGAIRTAIWFYLAGMDQNYKILKDKIVTFRDEYPNLLKEVPGKNRKEKVRLDVNKMTQKEKDLLWGKRPIKDHRDIQVGKIKEALVRRMKGTFELLENNLFRTISHDAKYDFLKNLMIADTNLSGAENSCCVAPIKVIEINRPFPLACELIEGENLFEAKINITESDILWNSLKMSDTQQAILDRERLFKIIYQFSKRLLEEEIRFFEDFGENKVIEQLRTIEEDNNAERPVSRIGGNEGFLSLTIGLLIKDKDPALYERVIAHTTKNKSYNELHGFPKTRRLADYGNKGFKSIGWVKLSCVPLGAGLGRSRRSKPSERMPHKGLENGLKALKGKYNQKR